MKMSSNFHFGYFYCEMYNLTNYEDEKEVYGLQFSIIIFFWWEKLFKGLN